MNLSLGEDDRPPRLTLSKRLYVRFGSIPLKNSVF